MKAYERFKDEPGFTRVATLEELRAKDGNLSIPLFVAPATANGGTAANPAEAGQPDLPAAINAWLQSSQAVKVALGQVLGGKGVGGSG